MHELVRNSVLTLKNEIKLGSVDTKPDISNLLLIGMAKKSIPVTSAAVPY